MNYLRLLFFCFFTTFVFSQNTKHVVFRALTVEQGLSQNNVVSIAQDSIGFMWFNTEDGLNKYDGKETRTYYLTSNKTKREAKYLSREVFVDKIGKLWAINNYGQLNYYNQEIDKFIELPELKEVITIAQDSDLNYFIGTYGQGLFKIDYQSKDTIQILKPQDKHFAVCSFIETDKHSILATTDDGIIEIKNNNYEFIELASKTIFSRFAKTSAGTIYLGSYEKGLYIKTKNSEGFKQFKGFDDSPLPDDLIVKDLLVDKRDWLWITTERRGVFLLDFKLKTIQNFRYNKEELYSIGSNSLFFLHEDNSGIIWIGTKGAGVNYFDAYLSKFNSLTNDQVPNNIHIDGIRAITTDDKNTIWIGTENNGLTKIVTQKDSFFTYTIKNSELVGDRIVSLYYDDGSLWIGHLDNGLQILNPNGKMKTYKQTSSFTILKIYKDVTNNMWLCTNKGLILFDKDKGILKQFNSNNSGLTTNYYISTIEQDINTIVQGDTNTLWVGTEFEGLYKLNLSDNKFSLVEGISDRIFSLYYNNSQLWIGTNGNGLKLYDTESGSISKFSTKDGFPNDIIYSILPDSDGHLWLTSNKGITRFKFENDSISSIKNYDNYFGIQSHGFNAGAYHKDKLGNLYFGGVKGINWFNPDELKTNPILPKTVLTKLELFNKEIPFSDNLELSSDQNTLSFTFASLQFSQPELNQYKYRLINNDEDWIDAGYNSIAHYTNLPPNNYTFQVISSNYDGVWNDTPATYSFTILKPWYLNNFAKLIYVILVLLTVYGIYKYLKWRWQMNMKLELESKETARLKKLDEYKTKLYNNISHEFRTPLTLISGPVENQLSKPNLSKSDKHELDLIKRNSKRLLNLVNQLLDLSKLETGNLKLKVSKGNLGIILKQLASAFEFKSKEKNIDFSYNIGQIENAWFDRDVIEKIVGNLLNNAVKYAPENGFVKFTASVNQDYLTATVVNNGNNLKDDELPKLFQRYYQNNTHSEGVGIGLSLVKELTVLSHGNIIAHSINKDEIQFTVTLPIEQSYFNATEIMIIERDLEESSFYEYADNGTEISNKSINEKPVLLIVEDDKDIRSFVKGIFNDSYKILEAQDGDFGIQTALEYIPDIIVSDVMMPKIDGIELCNTLKENIKTSHIPLVLLTAKSGDHNEIEGLRTGADAYMTKPFNSEKLKIRIDKLLNNMKKLQEYYSKNNALNFHNLQVTSSEKLFFKKLEQAIKENIVEQEFTSEKLASEMDMSRTQLHRKLKALLGLTASEFIRNERLKIGVELLKKSDSTVSEIAYQIGFNTPSYFIKCFKEVYNCTPKEYLQSL